MNSIDIINIVEKALGVKPDNIKMLIGGVMTFKYQFAYKNELFILRIYPPCRRDISITEYELLIRLHNAGCMVPEPVCQHLDDHNSFIIYKKVKGHDLLELSKRKQNINLDKISEDIIYNIKMMTSINFQYYGSVMGEQPTYDSWNEFLLDAVTKGQNIINSSHNKMEYLKLINFDFLYNQIDKLAWIGKSLVWSDFDKSNIIINNNNFVSFIDFEGCFSGDPMLSIGYLYSKEGQSEFYLKIIKACKKIYNFDESLIVFYSLIRILRIVKYANEQLPIGIVRTPLEIYFKGLKDAIYFTNKLKHA